MPHQLRQLCTGSHSSQHAHVSPNGGNRGHCAGSKKSHKLPGKRSTNCIETFDFQEVFAGPGTNSTGIEVVFNDAATFEPPRPVQKANIVNQLYAGATDPAPENLAGELAVRSASGTLLCAVRCATCLGLKLSALLKAGDARKVLAAHSALQTLITQTNL